MRECYCDALSKLISIEWEAWVVLNTVCLAALGLAAATDAEGADHAVGVTVIFISLGWICFLMALWLYLQLSGKVDKFRQHLAFHKDDLQTVIREWRASEARESAECGSWREEGDVSFMRRLSSEIDKKQRAGLQDSEVAG